LAVIAPELERKLAALVSRLEDRAPTTRALVPSHGDFSIRQLLQTEAGLAVIDPDGACLAPPALDIAAFAARRVRGQTADLGSAVDVLDALVSGYGTRPPALKWYLAASVLIRADAPFVRLEDDWPARVAEIVDVAKSALQA
jgi:thiamine kinase-like enzyme